MIHFHGNFCKLCARRGTGDWWFPPTSFGTLTSVSMLAKHDGIQKVNNGSIKELILMRNKY